MCAHRPRLGGLLGVDVSVFDFGNGESEGLEDRTGGPESTGTSGDRRDRDENALRVFEGESSVHGCAQATTSSWVTGVLDR